MAMVRATVKRLHFVLGIIFLVIAIIGVVLPVLPTTPFILLALYFFDKSSEKFHNWCLKIPGFGARIDEWQRYRIIRLSAKIQAIALIVVSGVYLAYKESLSIWLRAGVISILLVVILFLVTRPSKLPENLVEQD